VDVLDIRKVVDSYCGIFKINTVTYPESLAAYPHIRKLYITLNTGLLSSTAVERFFLLGGSKDVNHVSPKIEILGDS